MAEGGSARRALARGDKMDKIRLSLYDLEPSYGSDAEGFDMLTLDEIRKLSEYYWKESKKKEFLVGINSNSLSLPDKHHLFLEWDLSIPYTGGFPDAHILTKSDRGFHIIAPRAIPLIALTAIQRNFGCCSGFIDSTRNRGFACLRVSQKNGVPLKIVHDSGSQDPIFRAYRLLVAQLNYPERIWGYEDPIRAAVEEAVGNHE